MMLIMWSMWCNVKERNKPEWMKSAVGCVLSRWWKVERLTSFPSCSSFICLCCHLVDRCRSWQHCKPCTGLKTKRHSTRWSLLYSSNFKIYWDWLVFANNSQANSSTKHEVRKRLQWPQHQNRRLMVGCKNVFVIITINREKKKISAQEHLNLPKNKTGVKTGQIFFFLIISHILLQTQVYDHHQYKVSIILNNIPNENKQTPSFNCDLLQIKDPLKLERENK